MHKVSIDIVSISHMPTVSTPIILYMDGAFHLVALRSTHRNSVIQKSSKNQQKNLLHHTDVNDSVISKNKKKNTRI